jgi:hypothetical protein
MLSIGDKVVCIDSSMQPHTVAELLKDCPNWVVKDKQYTIRAIIDLDFVVGVYLEEVSNPPKWFKVVNKFMEPTFRIDRFRKIEEVTKEISVEQEELITL